MAKTRNLALTKNWGLMQFTTNQWSYILEEGQQIEDLLKRQFWASVAVGDLKRNVKPGEIVYVRSEDVSVVAWMIVRGVGPGWIHMEFFKDANGNDMIYRFGKDVVLDPDSPLQPKWDTAAGKWAVIRAKDSYKIEGGFSTKDDAVEWIIKHNATVA